MRVLNFVFRQRLLLEKALIAVLLCHLLGCSTTSGQAPESWGWSRIRDAAVNAATSPATWAPAAGALAFSIGNADRKVSDWASSRAPVYGSQERAGRISDTLLRTSDYLFVGSALASPLYTIPAVLSVETGAGILMRSSVGAIKQKTGRTRPNGRDKVSFPSGHSAGSSISATLAYRNIEPFTMPYPAVDAASQVAFTGIAAATAWARVEAKQHYPSDVLAGAAIGHFFGVFLTDLLLGPVHSTVITPVIQPAPGGFVASLTWHF